MTRFPLRTALIALVVAATAAAPTEGAAQRLPAGPQPRADAGWLGLRAEGVIRLHLDTPAAPESVFTVIEVYRDGPAWAAGIRAGDVVEAVNGRPADLALFQSVAQRLQPGDPIAFVVRREGRRRDFSIEAAPRPGVDVLAPTLLQTALDSTRQTFVVRLDSVARALGAATSLRVEVKRIQAGAIEVIQAIESEAPDRRARRVAEPRAGVLLPAGGTTAGAARPLAPYLIGTNRVAGAELTPLVAEMAAYFGPAAGLLVTEVADRTPASDAGLAPGDVIVAARGRTVATVDQLRAALVGARSATTLHVVRRGLEIELRLPD